MPRPYRCRRIAAGPAADYFKPQGIPLARLEEVVLTLDELEALRLAHLNGMYQEKAAELMGVSRQTFGNILNGAHRKMTDALVNGKALKIEGGIVKMTKRRFVCFDCDNEWDLPFGTGRPEKCPKCESPNIGRLQAGRGLRGNESGWRAAGPGRGRCRRGQS